MTETNLFKPEKYSKSIKFYKKQQPERKFMKPIQMILFKLITKGDSHP